MSCSPFDLRDYLFGELAETDRRQVDQHVRGCSHCHDDLERLRLTHSTLLALRDEEVPQRIGFVSDKVFEPSPVRRAWHAFWGSSAKLGFASAAMLSAALVTVAFFRPAAAVPAPVTDTAKIEQQISERAAAAVQKAVAESEARQARKTAELLQAAEQRFDEQRRADMVNVSESIAVLQKRYNVREILSARLEEPK
ncbi:MAG: zf-HC2 domain-containing protein [Acidobacteriia bacterium]|nr:zf-HC2 domain-containing protein [Terriglobia bacterium]